MYHFFLKKTSSSLKVPGHISCIDHQKEWDEIRTSLALVDWLEGSSKMLAQALPLSEVVPAQKYSFYWESKNTYNSVYSQKRIDYYITSNTEINSSSIFILATCL